MPPLVQRPFPAEVDIGMTTKPAILVFLACIVLTLVGCVSTSPAPLRGEARQVVANELARFDGPSGPARLHATPGVVHLADGSRIEYDRTCLVGSRLSEDRTAAFRNLIARLQEAGGEFQTLEYQNEEIDSILVNLDGQRIRITTLKW